MSTTVTVTVAVPRPFRFRLMVLSHGWSDLPPFRWDEEAGALDAAWVEGGRAVAVRVTSERDRTEGQRLRARVIGGPPMDVGRKRALRARLRSIFRLDEDLSPFYGVCRRHRSLPWVEREGLGRFLRNPTLFEEFVKVLLTTNVNWGGTRAMTRALVDGLGEPALPWSGGGNPARAFPSAEAIAALTEKRLREEMRLGYRAPFLLGFARAVAEGRIDLEEFRDGRRATEDLARALTAVKGFGPYAANSLLLGFGRYDRLVLDSWIRKTVASVHFRSPKVADRSIERHYARFGEWKALACWFDCAWASWMKDAIAGPSDRFGGTVS